MNSSLSAVRDHHCNKRRDPTRFLLRYASSVPLPASGSVCESPLALAPLAPAPPPDVLGPVGGAFPGAAAPGLTADVPGLAARSLGFSKLLKKFCSTSCCVGLGALPRIGDVGAPARLPRPKLPRVALVPPLPPSISARARSTVGREKDEEPNGPTRPAGGGADASVGVRKIPRGSRSARRAFSS